MLTDTGFLSNDITEMLSRVAFYVKGYTYYKLLLLPTSNLIEALRNTV